MIKPNYEYENYPNNSPSTVNRVQSRLSFKLSNKKSMRSENFLKKIILLLRTVEEMNLCPFIYDADKQRLVNMINDNNSVIIKILKENVSIVTELCKLCNNSSEKEIKNLRNAYLSKKHSCQKNDSFPKSCTEIESDVRFPKSDVLMKFDKNLLETGPLNPNTFKKTYINSTFDVSQVNSDSLTTIGGNKTTESEKEISRIISEEINRFYPDVNIREDASHSSNFHVLSNEKIINSERLNELSMMISEFEDFQTDFQNQFTRKVTPLMNRDVNFYEAVEQIKPAVDTMTNSFTQEGDYHDNAVDITTISTPNQYTEIKHFLGAQLSSSTIQSYVSNIPQMQWIQKH